MKEHRRRPGRGMPFRNAANSAKGGDWRATVRTFVVLVGLIAAVDTLVDVAAARRATSAYDPVEPRRTA